jgi:hypothetical protein
VWAIALILVMGVGLRLFAYGDLRQSVVMLDTRNYVEASKTPLFTWDSLTGPRLLTTSMIYHYFRPPQGYLLKPVNTSAGDWERRTRLRRTGFDDVVIFQAFLSLVGWTSLAIVFSRHVEQRLVKVFGAALIVLFAFSPPVADWDSVLSSESPNLSLFALTAALLIEIVFWVATRGDSGLGKPTLVLFAIWFCSLFLWTFVRDSNLYAVLVTLVMVLPLFILPYFRRRLSLVILTCLMIGLFALGYHSSQTSKRWKTPLEHVFSDKILPYPLRVSFLQKIGMPSPDSPSYKDWFDQRAPGAYVRFLIAHPGYTLPPLFENMQAFFTDNLQPYYHVEKDSLRVRLLALGDMLHPRSSAVFLVDLLLLTSLLWLAYKGRGPMQIAWAWLGCWVFLSASLTLLVSFHADTWGISRHVMGSILLYRLFFWLFLLVVIDYVIGMDAGDAGELMGIGEGEK